MPTQKKRKNRERIKQRREFGFIEASFECECGFIGSTNRGGEARHRKSKKCREFFERRNATAVTTQVTTTKDETVPVTRPAPVDIVTSESEDEVGHYSLRKRRKVNVSSALDNAYLAEDDGYVAQFTTNIDVQADQVPAQAEEPPDFGEVGRQLGDEELHIVRHPNAELAPSTLTHGSLIEYEPPLYWPFKTREDFEQTEIMVMSELTAPVIDAQLAFCNKLQGNTNRLTLKTAREMHETLREGFLFDESKQITGKIGERTFEYTLYSRDFLEALRELLRDPEVSDHLAMHAERHYIARPDGKGNMRTYSEYYHADDMWEIETNLGVDTRPLILQIYTDETQLTAFGNTKLWPVYFWIANLPASIRQSHGKGGATLLGFLPEVGHLHHVPADLHAEFRSGIYHQAFQLMLRSLKISSSSGDFFLLGRGQIVHFTTVIGLKSVDYLELIKMECNIGLMGAMPCPVCLVPRESLPDTDKEWPDRDPNWKAEIQCSGKDLREEAKRIGMRTTPNAFDYYTNKAFSGPKTVCGDVLHMLNQGEEGRVWIPGLIEKLKTPVKKKLIDEQYQLMPRYPNLTHFAQGITSLKWRSGSDHSVISRTIVPVLFAAIDHSFPSFKRIIKLFRALGECDVLIGLRTQTDATLDFLSERLKELAKCEKELAPHWKISLQRYKFHFLQHHFVDGLRAKGPACITDTGHGEARHRETKRLYANTNRHPNSMKLQIARNVQYKEVVGHVRARIKALEELVEEAPVEAIPDSRKENVKLGSCQNTCYITGLSIVFPAEMRPDNEAVKGLFKSLARLLYYQIPELQKDGISIPRDEHLPNISRMKIVPCRLAYIRYISLIDNAMQTDQIRSTPKWRDQGPRFDFVLLNWDHNTKRCAQVIQLLYMTIREQTHALALVRLLGPLTRNSATGYLHASNTLEYRWVFAKSFIRSIHVHPPSELNPRYIINDLIDGDFYFRLRDAEQQQEIRDRGENAEDRERDYEAYREEDVTSDYSDREEQNETDDDLYQ